jgi:hypothetical protein
VNEVILDNNSSKNNPISDATLHPKRCYCMVAHDEQATTYNLLAVVAEALHTWIGTLHMDIAKLAK